MILGLTALLFFVVAVTVLGIITLELLNYDTPVSNTAKAIGAILAPLVAILVGYLGGRTFGRTPKADEAEGRRKGPPEA